MKFLRNAKLSVSDSARKLSGNPPRTHSCSYSRYSLRPRGHRVAPSRYTRSALQGSRPIVEADPSRRNREVRSGRYGDRAGAPDRSGPAGPGTAPVHGESHRESPDDSHRPGETEPDRQACCGRRAIPDRDTEHCHSRRSEGQAWSFPPAAARSGHGSLTGKGLFDQLVGAPCNHRHPRNL